MSTNPEDVFINCRFDPAWSENFNTLVFAVIGCGFRVRCAREADDASGTRVEKLYGIIEESRYGIHDLSFVQLDPDSGLPRFNMPLELGFFLAAKRFGGSAQKEKRCLILETEQYRYMQFVSDLNGMDIQAHHDDVGEMITAVRNFLFTSSRRKTIPTAQNLRESHNRFRQALPAIAAAAGHNEEDLTFADYEKLVIEWVIADSSLGSQA